MATATLAPAKTAFYHPELDILRFGAFLMVFLVHSAPPHRWAWAHGGAYGVDLFFALSSYLITELLLREHRDSGTIHVKAFYIRRILRIWPLYFAFLLLVRPVFELVFPRHGEAMPWKFLLPYFLLVGNWPLVLFKSHVAVFSIAGALWSISVEEQFYLSWPLVMKRWIRHLPAICVGMFVVANLTRIVSVILHPDGVWFNTFARLDPIAGGALLAYFLHGKSPKLSHGIRAGILFAGVAAILAAGLWGSTFGWQCLWAYPLVALGSLLLIGGALTDKWKPGRTADGLVYLGKISYGLYVFHLAALAVIHALRIPTVPGCVAALALDIGAAALSYQVLEKPFLRLKERFAVVRSRPV